MTTPRYAQLTRKLFADGRPEVAATPPSAEARALAIDALEHAIAVEASQYRRRRFSSAIAVAAGIVLALGGGASWLSRSDAHAVVAVGSGGAMAAALGANGAVLHLQGAGVEVVGQNDARVADGAAIAPGQRLVTRSSGRALLAFASGTEVALDQQGDLTIVEDAATQRFALAAGSVTARVTKVAVGHRFIIGTADSEIEVHGTAFRVSVVAPDPACGSGVVTRVGVFEGTVAVRHGGHETAVSAGEHWPAGCAPAADATASPTTAADAKKLPPSAASAPSSRLAEQNDLFGEAVAAKRRGATGTAIATFERFASTYPASPLAESAMAERMKLLRTTDRARARGAAEQYLARYPGGFARGIAQAILEESP